MTPRAPPALRWGLINRIQLPPEEPMELMTAAEPQSPVDQPLDFSDVRSGVKEAEKDVYCTPSGAQQAEDANRNEQDTVATCLCPEEAPKTVQDMLATPPAQKFCE